MCSQYKLPIYNNRVYILFESAKKFYIGSYGPALL